MTFRIVDAIVPFLVLNTVSVAAVVGLDARSRGGTDLSLATGDAFIALRNQVSSMGHTMIPLSSFQAADLDGIDALILMNPSGNSQRFSSGEIASIHDAVLHRMGLVILGESAADNDAVVANLNALTSPFGVEYSRFINETNPYGPATNIFINHPVTALLCCLPNPGIVVWNQRRLVRIDPPALDLTTTGGRDDIMAAVDGLPCSGNMVFLSDSTLWWDPAFVLNVGLDEQANRQLLVNTVGFVTQAIGAFPDCNTNDLPDACDLAAGRSPDCNDNSLPDECDIAGETSDDFNDNGIPDECDPDCQPNGIPDFIDIGLGLSEDCNLNEVPDECEPGDFDSDGVLDICDDDIDDDGVPNADDDCDFTYLQAAVDLHGRSYGDLNLNCTTDAEDWVLLTQGLTGPLPTTNGGMLEDGGRSTSRGLDCNENGVPDDDDIANGTSTDFNGNGVPDECEPDCQPNGIPDFIDISVGTSEDCNNDEIPDECQEDFDGDGVIDLCDDDADADGVADDSDQCLFTPLGTAVNAEGRPYGDIDEDCDTDLEDYGLFQRGFSGTQQ